MQNIIDLIFFMKRITNDIIHSQNFELDPKYSSKKDEESDDDSDSDKNKADKTDNS